MIVIVAKIAKQPSFHLVAPSRLIVMVKQSFSLVFIDGHVLLHQLSDHGINRENILGSFRCSAEKISNLNEQLLLLQLKAKALIK